MVYFVEIGGSVQGQGVWGKKYFFKLVDVPCTMVGDGFGVGFGIGDGIGVGVTWPCKS